MEIDEPYTAFRLSGRTPSQARAMTCRLGVLGRADGSAQWEQDQTVIVAAVHGPLVVGGNRENASEAVIEVIFKPFSGVPGPRERHLESVIQSTLKSIVHTARHPRTCIQVVLQAAHEDGSVLAVALNASVAALLDACIPMRTLFAAACIAVTPANERLLDPDCQEEKVAESLCTVGFNVRRTLDAEGSLEPEIGSIALSCASGCFSLDDYLQTASICRAGAMQTAAMYYRALESREHRPS